MALYVKLKKSYADFALDVEFEAENGVTALLGASGCGKSLTLKCIAGVVKPDEGLIVNDGVTFFDSAHNINLSPQKRRVGLLFQNYALFPNMTVRQNLLTGLAREKKSDSKREKLARIERVFRLEELSGHYPHQLSGGQAQRVALARILAGEPRVLMLDEPFAALDSYLKWKLEQELADTLSAFPGAALYVSHSRDEVYRLSDSVCVMENGKTQPVMPVKALFDAPQTLSAALLSGCKNFSRAERMGARGVFASDWGVTLDCGREVGEDVRFIGVRAHNVRFAGENAVNRVPCAVERVVEDVFSIVAALRPENAAENSDYAQIRVETEKAFAGRFTLGGRVEVSIRPGDIMLLR
ncbi:MAG: ATP-binding cassette domain-containing protein [Clostridiaceae bacterium]|nr:ATP-binding cassette domain-containing protein [Eubacteriales bacterium]